MTPRTTSALQAAAPQQWKLLVVDDEEAVVVFLEMLLEDAGYQLVTADGVQSALARLEEAPVDLIITDKNMKDGDGLEILAWANEHLPDTELMMMTANPTVSSAVEAIHHGVGDYIQKPIDTDDFLARVERVLRTLTVERANKQLVEELRVKNARLEEMAVRDGLTGLYNHAHFQDQLEAELKRSSRHGHEFALVFIDVDRFKQVNDTLGHPVGDEVLKRIASLLRGETPDDFRLREHDLAARYGGDEFVLVMPETSKSAAATKAEQLRAVFAQQIFEEVSEALMPSLSIGVAAYPIDADNREKLIEAADAALYSAKRLGRNRVMSFAPAEEGAPEAELDPRLHHARALEESVAQRSFRFVYQPIVNAVENRVIGYEALCRPMDERFKHVGEVIVAAERSGRINALGRVLRDTAVTAISELEEPLLMFINLHPQELNDPDLIAGRTDLEPWAGRVVLEITETAQIPSFDRPRRHIAALRERGFRVAIDDLGAGYAGLVTLTQLRPDFVKLDMGLVRGIHSDSTTARLVRHLCHFCDEEGIIMIAEGVETAEEREVVQELGCNLMQGYLFARPGPPFPRL